jgi:hypothetical protein
VKAKYLIIKKEEMEVAVIFSSFLSHDAVDMTGQTGVQSAGYCEMSPAGKWVVSGQSVSLKLNSRPQDAEILNKQLGMKKVECQTAACTA